MEGVDTANSSISMAVDSLIFTDIVEIIPLNEKAIKNLEGAPIWKY